MSRSEQKNNMNFKALYELGCMVMAKMIALSTQWKKKKQTLSSPLHYN